MIDSAINFLQWNCRSLQRRLPDLLYLLENFKINIAALCETRLDNHIIPSLANYDIHTSNRNRYGGGVAIIIGKEYRFTYIKEDHIEQLCTRNEIELLIGKI